MKKHVSLVLSSGGARGIFHIGVIEELERQGFEIKSIAGSSIGALVGGIYASGNLTNFKSMINKMDGWAIFNLMDFTLSADGFIKGNKIIKELKKMVMDVPIEELPIHYTAVATDIKNRKEVVFNKGSLYDAIRASISIPSIFKPVRKDGMVLMDGGIYNPIPINLVKRTNNDLLIVVDINSQDNWNQEILKSSLNNKTKEGINSISTLQRKFPSIGLNQNPLNYYTIIVQTAGIMIQRISSLSLEMNPPDILISFPMKSYKSFQFHKSSEIVKYGVQATKNAITKYYHKEQIIN